MDAHSFRLVGHELLHLLSGARVEKIHSPAMGVCTFVLFTSGKKERLVVRFERQSPLIFLTSHTLTNPSRPPAFVMRLRKYSADKRLGDGIVDFITRSIAFPILSHNENSGMFLLISLRTGIYIVNELPPAFGDAPAWPDGDLVASLCNQPWSKKDKEGPWQEYAVLTPALRETLAALDPMEGRALLVDLEEGNGELFVYADAKGEPCFYAAWPLPPSLLKRRNLMPAQQPDIDPGAAEYPSLAKVSHVDEKIFFATLGAKTVKKEQLPAQQEKKRLTRLFAKLDQEEIRLNKLMAQRQDALALQQVLWQYPASAKVATVSIASDTSTGEEQNISLNPLLTIRENMAHMFHQSSRGARGLEFLKTRRAEIAQNATVETRPSVAIASDAKEKSTPENASTNADPSSRPTSFKDGSTFIDKNGKELKDVTKFLSSDGFSMLRGKNARGNQALLKLGQGHDLWLHAEDGPSAHLIIRRAHAQDTVPENSLREAATLVGEKSWQRYDAKARIMVALLRNVHPIKGAAPGTVKVDSVLQSITISLSPSDQ